MLWVAFQLNIQQKLVAALIFPYLSSLRIICLSYNIYVQFSARWRYGQASNFYLPKRKNSGSVNLIYLNKNIFPSSFHNTRFGLVDTVWYVCIVWLNVVKLPGILQDLDPSSNNIMLYLIAKSSRYAV
jgi:hypothetical protein